MTPSLPVHDRQVIEALAFLCVTGKRGVTAREIASLIHVKSKAVAFRLKKLARLGHVRGTLVNIYRNRSSSQRWTYRLTTHQGIDTTAVCTRCNERKAVDLLRNHENGGAMEPICRECMCPPLGKVDLGEIMMQAVDPMRDCSVDVFISARRRRVC